MEKVRYTKAFIEEILKANEGFKREKYENRKNYKATNYYTITDGQMKRHAVGRRVNETIIMDTEQVRRYIKRYPWEFGIK